MSWMTNWEEARLHPWRTRLFLFVSFAVLLFVCAAIAGELTGHVVAVAGVSVVASLAATALCEPLLRSRSLEPRSGASFFRFAATLGVFGLAIGIGVAVGSVLATVAVILAGVVLILWAGIRFGG